MNHPANFNNGDTIQSVYSGISYRVISKDKKGMAILLNLQTDKTEEWNTYNNPHFIELKGQLKLF